MVGHTSCTCLRTRYVVHLDRKGDRIKRHKHEYVQWGQQGKQKKIGPTGKTEPGWTYHLTHRLMRRNGTFQ